MVDAPYLYDQVKLDDGTQGVVRYIGEVKGRDGTFFGLEMLADNNGLATADTTGTIDGQQYFVTDNNAQTGRFVTDEDIATTVKSTHSLNLIGEAPRFTVGDRVMVLKTIKKGDNKTKIRIAGMVHYVGVPKFAKQT